jgi:hypothetical protein
VISLTLRLRLILVLFVGRRWKCLATIQPTYMNESLDSLLQLAKEDIDFCPPHLIRHISVLSPLSAFSV